MAKSPLQVELKKTGPFTSPAEEAFLNMLRTVGILEGAFARLFKEHGLSHPQYNILRILRGAGEPLPCLAIASRMVTREPDITRLVDRLEKAQLVTRQRAHTDRRVVQVAITKVGLELLEKLDNQVAARHQENLGHMTAAELQEISRLMAKVRRSEAES